MQEGLSMEVDTLVVSGRTHVNQVPVHQLVGVHPQTLQVVYDSVDGWEQRKTSDTTSLCLESLTIHDTATKNRGLQWNMSFFLNSGPIILLRLFLCTISWFFSWYQLFVSSKVMNSSVNSLQSVNFLARVPLRHTNRGPIKPEWMSRSCETAQVFLFFVCV